MGQPGGLDRDGRLFGEGGQNGRVELGEVGGVGGAEDEDQSHGLVVGVQGDGHDGVLHFPGGGNRQGRLREQGRQEGELLAAEGEVGYRLVEQGTDAGDLRTVQTVGAGDHEAADGVVPGGNDGGAAAQGAHGVAQDALKLRLKIDGVVVVGSTNRIPVEIAGDH